MTEAPLALSLAALVLGAPYVFFALSRSGDLLRKLAHLRLSRLLESAVHLLALALATETLSAFLFALARGGMIAPRLAETLVQVSTGVAVAAVVAWSILRRNRPRTSSALFISGLPILAVASTGWSLEPANTLTAAARLIAITVYFTHLGNAGVIANPAARAAKAAYVLAMMSAGMGVAFPTLGLFEDFRGGLRLTGLFGHPNQLGMVTGLGAVLAVSARGIHLVGRSSMIATLLLVTASSGSVSALIGSTAMVLIVLARRATRSRQVRLAWLVACVGPVVATLVWLGPRAYLESATEALGRDATLTGRTALWSEAASRAENALLLGNGFAATWAPGSPVAESLYSTLLWRPAYAHNGFLDLLLDLGLVGVLVGTSVLARSAFSAWRYRHRALHGLSAGIAFLLLVNMVEGGLFQPTYQWGLLVYLAAHRTHANVTPGRVQ